MLTSPDNFRVFAQTQRERGKSPCITSHQKLAITQNQIIKSYCYTPAITHCISIHSSDIQTVTQNRTITLRQNPASRCSLDPCEYLKQNSLRLVVKQKRAPPTRNKPWNNPTLNVTPALYQIPTDGSIAVYYCPHHTLIVSLEERARLPCIFLPEKWGRPRC